MAGTSEAAAHVRRYPRPVFWRIPTRIANAMPKVRQVHKNWTHRHNSNGRVEALTI
jgi:hypothetical protein